MKREQQSIDPYERDTDASEDIPNLFQFLLPSSDFLSPSTTVWKVYTQFNVGYNANLFQGWVKQPSPCCAASSVAGAWNAMHSYSRNHTKSLQFNDILSIYQQLTLDKIEKKTNAFHRKLGYYASSSTQQVIEGKEEVNVLSLDLCSPSFWDIFDKIARNQFMKELGGKKENQITKKVMEKILRQMIHEQYLEPLQALLGTEIKEFKDVNPENRSFFYCLMELLELENQSVFLPSIVLEPESKKYEEEKETAKESERKEKSEFFDPDEEEVSKGENMKDFHLKEFSFPFQELEDDDEGEETEITSSNKVFTIEAGGKPNKSSKSAKKKEWDWRKDFMEIVKAKSGLLKLSFQERPSTAYIGNWGILDAISSLSEQALYGNQLTARLFMGKKKFAKSKLDFPISMKDSEEVIQSQWEGIK
jgi:hypothetical protein